MRIARLGLGGLAAGALALAGAFAPVAPAASSAGTNHAAIVIDTADGKVRKFCLAFPEATISGAEALRRIESSPVFATYGGKGQAVCSLCGVGCPASNCFCDSAKYWAYHRAGPGGAPYQFARAGASATEVRNGDVEGWRWGTGQPPPAATVSEVCAVPEPPARTASSSSGDGSGGGGGGGGESAPEPQATTTTPPASSPPASSDTGGPSTMAAGPAPAPRVRPGAAAAGDRSPTSTGPAPPPADAGGSSPTEPPAPPPPTEAPATGAEPEQVLGDVAAPSTAGAGTRSAAPSVATGADAGGRGGAPIGLAGFGALLAGLLVWLARLRAQRASSKGVR